MANRVELTISKEQFRGYIEKCVEKGKTLYDRFKTSTEFIPERATEMIKSWDRLNKDVLMSSFSIESNEYYRGYPSDDDIALILVPYSLTRSRANEIVGKKLLYFEEVLERIDYMRVDGSVKKLPSPIKDQVEINSVEIFVVHGHNSDIKTQVARTLEQVGLKPIILHEQSNSGKTIIEKFEKHSNVGFAVVILTADDLGKGKDEDDLKNRARQNVVLELGYFIGKLTRERVLCLFSAGVERPSDLFGLAMTEIDNKGFWKYEMIIEMNAVGYKLDANKIK